MVAEDIRKGNLVCVDGKEIIVESIDETGINFEVDYGIYGGIEYEGLFYNSIFRSKNVIKPVLLTREKIISLGFEEVGLDVIGFCKDDVYLQHINNAFEYKTFFGKTKIIDYVHQLQNLFFSIENYDLKTNNINKN